MPNKTISNINVDTTTDDKKIAIYNNTTGEMEVTDVISKNVGTAAGAYHTTFHNTATTIASTGGGVNIRLDATTGNGFALMFSKSGGTAMQGIRCNYATNACALATPSDERVKENIETSKHSIDELMSIKVIDFVYSYDESKTKQTGFLAQNLAKVCPEAVYEGTEGEVDTSDIANLWSVDYGRVTPFIIKVMQDLVVEVDQLKEDLRLLKAQNNLK